MKAEKHRESSQQKIKQQGVPSPFPASWKRRRS
jgi:hypothetical protein